MVEIIRLLNDSVELRELVRTNAPLCFLCKWMLEDLEKNGKLTGWPLDSMGKGVFPVEGKMIHVLLELGEPLPSDPEDLEDLASVVVHALEVRTSSN